MYTGVQIFSDLRRQTKEYESDVIVPSMGDYLLKRAMYETIEENYKNLIVQKNKDELGDLLNTGVSYSVYDNGICLGVVPIRSIVATLTGYIITFKWRHHLGASVAIDLSSILGTIDANGSYSYVTVLGGANEYVIIDTTTIEIRIAGVPAGTYVPNTGYMSNGNMVLNYLHLLYCSAIFEVRTGFTLNGADVTTPIKIHISENNNLRSFEKIKISGVLGNTNANGVHYIQKLLLKTANLYSDKYTSVAVSGNGVYASGGVITRVISSSSMPLNSDEKADYYVPTVSNPRVEITQKQLLVYPKDSGCVMVNIDFISIPGIDISSVSTVDYELYYNRTFLDKIVFRAAKNFAVMVQDVEQFEMVKAQINNNTNAIS